MAYRPKARQKCGGAYVVERFTGTSLSVCLRLSRSGTTSPALSVSESSPRGNDSDPWDHQTGGLESGASRLHVLIGYSGCVIRISAAR